MHYLSIFFQKVLKQIFRVSAPKKLNQIQMSTNIYFEIHDKKGTFKEDTSLLVGNEVQSKRRLLEKTKEFVLL